MFHFKFICSLLIFSSFIVLGQSVFGDETPPEFSSKSHFGIYLGYLSWQENLTLQSANTKDYSTSNFSGNSLNFSYEMYLKSAPRHGLKLSAAYASGVSTAGGTQPILIYQFSNIPWSAETLSALYSFQLSPSIAIGLGPMILARQITYQSLANGTTASSGSSTNLGIDSNLRIALVKNWDLQFNFAGLSNNATTLWEFALGYVF